MRIRYFITTLLPVCIWVLTSGFVAAHDLIKTEKKQYIYQSFQEHPARGIEPVSVKIDFPVFFVANDKGFEHKLNEVVLSHIAALYHLETKPPYGTRDYFFKNFTLEKLNTSFPFESHLKVISKIDDKILSLAYDFQSYEGGAHGYEATYYYHYLLPNVQLITLNNLFKSEQLPIFFQLLETKLKKQLQHDLFSSSQELKDVAQTRFFKDDQKFVIALHPYEVASYYEGTITVIFDLNELKDMIKADHPFWNLFK